MKQILLLPIIFALFLFPVLAQGDESQSVKIDSSLKCRIFGEDDENLLFKSVEQTSPNSKAYYHLAVCENGDAVMYYHAPERGLKSIKRGKLTTDQIEEIKLMLVIADSQFLPFSATPEDEFKENYLIYFNNDGFQRRNYSGTLPDEMQKVIDFVKAEIRKQQKSIYVNEDGLENDPFRDGFKP